ncbi:MAG: hypothetical protein H8E37_01150, partial [Planctomycetes bacterium]|nr:hypothetical protein [Planctomycetota bacterium]
AGGGAIGTPEAGAALRAAARVGWLPASADTTEQRISGDQTTAGRRPNLTSQGGRAEIEAMLAQREPLYRECSSLEIATDEPLENVTELPTPEEFASAILKRLEESTPELAARRAAP